MWSTPQSPMLYTSSCILFGLDQIRKAQKPLEREATQVPHYAVKLTPAHRHSLAPLSVVLAHTASSPFKAVSNIAGVAYSEPVLGASELLDGSVSRRSRAATIHHCMGEE